MSADRRALILETLPEIALIENEKLRSQVVEIWSHFWHASGLEDVNEAPYSVHDLVETTLVDHTRAVTLSVLAVADVLAEIHDIDLDREQLLALALLHDVSKLIEYEISADGKDWSETGVLFPHGFMAAVKTLELDMGLELAHLILTHTIQSKKPPETTEGTLFHYIDMVCSDAIRAESGAERHLTGTPLYAKRRGDR